METTELHWYPERRRRMHGQTLERAKNEIILQGISLPDDVPNLVGKVIGLITIVGFQRRNHPARNNVWKAVCACGTVVYRRQHWVKNPRQDGYDRCPACK